MNEHFGDAAEGHRASDVAAAHRAAPLLTPRFLQRLVRQVAALATRTAVSRSRRAPMLHAILDAQKRWNRRGDAQTAVIRPLALRLLRAARLLGPRGRY